MDEELLDIVPESPRHPYNMYDLIERIVDDGEYFDIKPKWAKTIITCFARFGGRPVGIVASQPKQLAGILENDSADKAARFVNLCDAFNIPLVFLQDVPGFMVGTKVEQEGIIRHGAKMLYAVSRATVPKITVVIRKAYGAGYYVMNGRAYEPDLIVAWPGAEISVMGAEGAVNIIFRKQIEAAEDPEATRKEMVDNFKKIIDPYIAAGNDMVDDIIDPRETRPRIIRGLEMAAGQARPAAVEEARRDAGVSDEDVEVVRTVMEAFARRDAPAVTELQDPEFEFRSMLADLAGRQLPRGRGRAVLRRHRRAARATGTPRTRRTSRCRDGRVLVMYRVAGRGRQSGVPLDQEMAMLWTLRGGKLLFAQTYLDLSEALQDARLEALDPLRKLSDAHVGRATCGRHPGCSIPTLVWEHNVGVGSPEEGVYHGREADAAAVRADHRAVGAPAAQADQIRMLEDGSFLLTGHLRAKHATSETVVVAPYEQQLEMRDGLLFKGRMTTRRHVRWVIGQNVAAVRRYIDAFNRRDLDCRSRDLDPDVELPSGQRRRAPRPITDPTGSAGRSTRGSRRGSG